MAECTVFGRYKQVDKYAVFDTVFTIEGNVKTFKQFFQFFRRTKIYCKHVFCNTFAVFAQHFSKRNHIFTLQRVEIFKIVGKNNVGESVGYLLTCFGTVKTVTHHTVVLISENLLCNAFYIDKVGVYLIKQ